MGNSLYLIENLKVFFQSAYYSIIYFKSVPKSIIFIYLEPSRSATDPNPSRDGYGGVRG
jgi:hypothetical protein